MSTLTGGCQCGAVRFSCTSIGRAAICHCRMCQKTFGNAFAPLVTGFGVTWSKDEPKRFASSNKVKRGFCGACGTPLTYEYEGKDIELAVGAFDHPEGITPALQVSVEHRLAWCEAIGTLPTLDPEIAAKRRAHFAQIHSNQHPDAEP